MEDKKPDNVKEIKMEIILGVDNNMKVNFPLLKNRMVTYGFLKLAEKTLDAHYNTPSEIIKPIITKH